MVKNQDIKVYNIENGSALPSPPSCLSHLAHTAPLFCWLPTNSGISEHWRYLINFTREISKPFQLHANSAVNPALLYCAI